MKIMIINGPNLNMLGVREKKIYGTRNYEDVCNYVKEEGKKRNHEILMVQSNSEGEIIDFIQKAYFEKYEASGKIEDLRTALQDKKLKGRKLVYR